MGFVKKTEFLTFLLFLIAVYIVFRSALSSYFFQDDWFTFTISKAKNINEFLSFFIPRRDVIYYRPIGMQVYFYIMENLFGVDNIAFRWSAIIVNSLNAYIIYRVLLKFKYKQYLAIFGGLFYAGSVAVYIPLFWSATFPFILGPLFLLASFLSFISKSKTTKILAFIFFVLGMLTLENTLILPVILLVWGILYKKQILYKDMLPYLVVGIFYIFLRLLIYPPPLTETYEISISVASTLRTYMFWLLNWPEEIGRQMIGPLNINPLFIQNFRSFVDSWIISSIVVIFMTVLIPLMAILVKNKRGILINKDFEFAIFWIILSLAPLILFASHMFPYYLPVTLFGFIFLVVNLLSHFIGGLNINRILVLSYLSVIILFWYWAALTVIDFNQKAYWAPKRAEMAKQIIDKLKNNIIYGGNYKVNISDESYYLPLNNQDGLRVIFGDNVETLYGESRCDCDISL